MCDAVGVGDVVLRGLKRDSEPLELELWAVMSHLIWVPGTKRWFSARAANTLTL